ncbi:MAG: tetratricopeptide repeat protein [Parcubacteria group bacterium]
MTQTHQASFLVTLTLLFLLPLFFIPGGALNLNVAKQAFLAFGVIVAVLVFLLELWRSKKLEVSWHTLILLALLLPAVYALSAFLATPSSLSLLGYHFEVGTFGYMLFGSLLLVLASTIFSSSSRALQVLTAFFISISLLVLFVGIKVFFGGDILVLGNFPGNMGNPLGSWTDLAISFGLLAAFAALAIGVIPMKLSVRLVVYAVFLLATSLLVIINFSTALILSLIASILLLLYFLNIEKHFLNTTGDAARRPSRFLLRSISLPVILGLVSLVSLINPTISTARGTLGDIISDAFKVENIDVRPSFSATLNISKAVLAEDGLLGSGPNTFGRDWLIYKPVDINSTPFWAVVFPFGIGFVPTQIASTGMLGTLLWLAFFVFLLFLGVKVFSRLPESRAERFALVSAFLITFFLWASSFLYVPSATVLTLAFIFTGLAVSLGRGSGVVPTRTFSLEESSQTRLVSSVVILVMMFGGLSLGWVGFNKTASAFHFQKAINLSNTADASLDEIESELGKAVGFSPADTYHIALSRLYFNRAQVALNLTTGTEEENRRAFEEAIRKSIEQARVAVSTNPASHQNWVALGMIYSALVPAPLSVAGAYENALFAYSEASRRNPFNPEIPLLLARLELNHNDKERARSFVRNAIALKEDYADAYLLLAQMEIEAGNTAGAIASTERLALLVPNNAGVYFELGLLKYSSKDYRGALTAFESALVSLPNYANAKYYLGLTLSQLGQLDLALEQFEALAESNPDSEEVRNILLDLQAGRRSFLDSPVTN